MDETIRERAIRFLANDEVMKALKCFYTQRDMMDRMVDSLRGMVDTGSFILASTDEKEAFENVLADMETRKRELLCHLGHYPFTTLTWEEMSWWYAFVFHSDLSDYLMNEGPAMGVVIRDVTHLMCLCLWIEVPEANKASRYAFVRSYADKLNTNEMSLLFDSHTWQSIRDNTGREMTLEQFLSSYSV